MGTGKSTKRSNLRRLDDESPGNNEPDELQPSVGPIFQTQQSLMGTSAAWKKQTQYWFGMLEKGIALCGQKRLGDD